MKINDLFEISPVIMAVKDEEGLKNALENDGDIIFILFGNILNIADIVNLVKERNKMAIVHVDLIAGLGNKEISVDYIKKNTNADGIISTKIMMVKRARELGMIAGLRTFMIDSIALDNVRKQLESFRPDFMEIMPGVLPTVLKRVRKFTGIPLVAGGLLSEKRDIMAAFEAGADAVSTTNEALWNV